MRVVDKEIRKIVNMPENIVPFLEQGRLIKICITQSAGESEVDWGWGILVNFTK